MPMPMSMSMSMFVVYLHIQVDEVSAVEAQREAHEAREALILNAGNGEAARKRARKA